MLKLKKIARRIISAFLYNLYYRFIYEKYNITRNGKRLLPGITAVVSAKNEGYTIPFCLRSLVGSVDQVVCIDNGSTDDTFIKMLKFKEDFGKQIEVEVLSMPDELLGDCREAGMKFSKYEWHLRWDADMVAKTTGDESFSKLREKILKDDRPRAIALPRTNIYGDLTHTSKRENIVDPGEPIMVWFNKHVCYEEYGKFDTIKIPYYYRMDQEEKRYYFHCAGLKSIENSMHRFHYFTWRDKLNIAKRKNMDIAEELSDFEKFKITREMKLFDTNDKKSLKFRYQRQLAELHYIKYDTQKYGDYPEILKEEIHNNRERFRVIYKDGKSYSRIDKEDIDMLEYEPTKADLDWNPQEFLQRLLIDIKS